MLDLSQVFSQVGRNSLPPFGGECSQVIHNFTDITAHKYINITFKSLLIKYRTRTPETFKNQFSMRAFLISSVFFEEAQPEVDLFLYVFYYQSIIEVEEMMLFLAHVK